MQISTSHSKILFLVKIRKNTADLYGIEKIHKKEA